MQMQATETFTSIQTQFLCAVPIKKIQWKVCLNESQKNSPILNKIGY